MKKKGKTVCQIIRFRGKIEAFLVSIDEFDISNQHGPLPHRVAYILDQVHLIWTILFLLNLC